MSQMHDLSYAERALADLGPQKLARLLLAQAHKDPTVLDCLKPALQHRTPEASGQILGESPIMQRLRQSLVKMARAEAPVLITGESGTGKELAAQTIHRCSNRANGPFIAINCAALPPSLIASELFGHEKGAFTGAEQRRIGRIEAADGGTLFLDEIGDLPLDLQTHLLRFLQENTIDRLGGKAPITINARVVAATNVRLRQAVAEGKFREDLFYRLNVLTIAMPPLRERGEDIARLCHIFLRKLAEEAGKPIRMLSDDAERRILTYPWPGNVRELLATVKRAVVMAEGETIEWDDLALPDIAQDANSLSAAKRDTEEHVIRKALSDHNHNISRTAASLGISRVTLYRMMARHNIAPR